MRDRVPDCKTQQSSTASFSRKDITADKAAQSLSTLPVKRTAATPSGRPAASASIAAQIQNKAGSDQIDRVNPGTDGWVEPVMAADPEHLPRA